MFEEPTLRARLVSRFFGSLVHVITLSTASLAADLGAIRLFGVGGGAPSPAATAAARRDSAQNAERPAYVNHLRLRLPQAWDAAMQEWPFSQDSIFEFFMRRNIRDGAFRPREFFTEQEFISRRYFRVLEPHAEVIDSYCLTFPVRDQVWAMLLFLRAKPSNEFSPGDASLLQRLKPAMAGAVRGAFLESLQLPSSDTIALSGPPRLASSRVPIQRDVAHLLATLSKTEYEVCELLRTNATERQVAEELGRSPHTIHVHVKNIYRKLSVNSRRDLVRLLGQ